MIYIMLVDAFWHKIYLIVDVIVMPAITISKFGVLVKNYENKKYF